MEAERYRERAIRLMQQNVQGEKLDPEVILEKIPDDWEMQTDDYDLYSLLSTMFQQIMTREENSKIAENLAQLEVFNAEIESKELQSAYLVIREDMDCQVCRHALGFKKIRIFPHGMAFHMKCSKDPHECPITKQRFDIDPYM